MLDEFDGLVSPTFFILKILMYLFTPIIHTCSFFSCKHVLCAECFPQLCLC